MISGKRVDKQGQMVTDKTVMWLVMVLLLAGVGMLVFKVDILNYIRNIPDYTLPEGEEIVADRLDEGVMADEKLCKVLVAVVKKDNQIRSCNNLGETCGGGLLFGLRWDVNEGDGKIKMEKIGLDVSVGKVSSKSISILSKSFTEVGNFFSSLKLASEYYRFLKNLDGAEYIGGGMICRDELAKIELFESLTFDRPIIIKYSKFSGLLVEKIELMYSPFNLYWEYRRNGKIWKQTKERLSPTEFDKNYELLVKSLIGKNEKNGLEIIRDFIEKNNYDVSPSLDYYLQPYEKEFSLGEEFFSKEWENELGKKLNYQDAQVHFLEAKRLIESLLNQEDAEVVKMLAKIEWYLEKIEEELNSGGPILG